MRDSGLGRYADSFGVNAIDHEVLSELAGTDLEKLAPYSATARSC
jgi:hypothetical protein